MVENGALPALECIQKDKTTPFLRQNLPFSSIWNLVQELWNFRLLAQW